MWLNKLEEKFGRYAIPNLPKIIVLLYAVGFVIANISPRLYSLLELNPYLILHGQVWRIVTFLLIGPETNLIFVIFVLLFYYSIGSSLEQVWNIPIQYVLFDRSFRNDRWGIFNLCDPYIRIWRRLWSVC